MYLKIQSIFLSSQLGGAKEMFTGALNPVGPRVEPPLPMPKVKYKRQALDLHQHAVSVIHLYAMYYLCIYLKKT